MAAATLVAERCRAELVARLHERREEIEQTALTRVHAIAAPEKTVDPAYAVALRAAVTSALDYGLECIAEGERVSEIPVGLLTQAHLAARNRVSLDTVLRRYFAGYTLLGDFLMEEAEAAGLRDSALKDLLRTQALIFDQLIAAVTTEYRREAEWRGSSTNRRRNRLVERLLAGELVDTSSFAYDFDANHLGVVAVGPGGAEALRELGAAVGTRALLIQRDELTAWGWLGSRGSLDPAEALKRLADTPSQLRLGFGEPGERLAGWRLTHEQAKAALSIGQRASEPRSRYADVALLASMLRDELLAASLPRIYLEPLRRNRDGGRVAIQTLRAYLAAGRNVTSAAAALGLSRNTVASRLRAIEEKVGRPLSSCATELQAALCLEDLWDEQHPQVTDSLNRGG